MENSSHYFFLPLPLPSPRSFCFEVFLYDVWHNGNKGCLELKPKGLTKREADLLELTARLVEM